VTGKKEMIPRVLEALADIAFKPEFQSDRVEKERKAVLSEAQMMNTIEYRIDLQLLRYLHEENELGCRFPIGVTDLVSRFTSYDISSFWKRWYWPGNATLYLVGDLDNEIEIVESLVKRMFGHLPKELETSNRGDFYSARRGEVRPPVLHKYGIGPGGKKTSENVKIFRHALLQCFQLSIFCKTPVQPLKTMEDLRHTGLTRLILAALQYRISRQDAQAIPPYISVDMDSSESGREGCTVSTLTIISEPKDWKATIDLVIREVRRLQQLGLTTSELQRYLRALVRETAQMANQSDTLNSVDHLNFTMECLALKQTIMDTMDSHETFLELAKHVTLNDVNAVARSLFSFISNYGQEKDIIKDFRLNLQKYPYEPTRAISIVVCFPAYIDVSGHFIEGRNDILHDRGVRLTTPQHIDSETSTASPILQEGNETSMNSGLIEFGLSSSEIENAISARHFDIDKFVDIEVPEKLVTDEEIYQKMSISSPNFVPIGIYENDPLPDPNPETGVSYRKLANGVLVSYRLMDDHPGVASVRLVVTGGRMSEKVEIGPSGLGSVAVGVRTLSESATLGPWQKEQTRLFLVTKLIDFVLECTEETVYMDFHSPVMDGGLRAVFEIAHLFFETPRWDPLAFERTKRLFISNYRSLQNSLERCTADRILGAMMGPDRRFREVSKEEVEALSLDGVRDKLSHMFTTDNLEVIVAGDFNPEELEEMVLKFIGTLSPRYGRKELLAQEVPVVPISPSLTSQHQRWHLNDLDDRACAYVAGLGPSKLDINVYDKNKLLAPPAHVFDAPPTLDGLVSSARRGHPVFRRISIELLSEILNSRLFTTVRDSLGLTYDVRFRLPSINRLQTMYYLVEVTSQPDRIHEALAACLRVLRNVRTTTINSRELERAKRVLLTRNESESKKHVYWIDMMQNSRRDASFGKGNELLRDSVAMIEACTVDDMNLIYDLFDFHNLYTYVGISGPKEVSTR
jgi:predicted Zn-dependent peptidase